MNAVNCTFLVVLRSRRFRHQERHRLRRRADARLVTRRIGLQCDADTARVVKRRIVQRLQAKRVLTGHLHTTMLESERQVFASWPVHVRARVDERVVKRSVLALLGGGARRRHGVRNVNDTRGSDVRALRAVWMYSRQVVRDG